MIYSKLESPERLEIDGKTYSAGGLTHLTKGQGQKLIKQKRKDGIEVRFSYHEGKPKRSRGRRKSNIQDDA